MGLGLHRFTQMAQIYTDRPPAARQARRALSYFAALTRREGEKGSNVKKVEKRKNKKGKIVIMF